MDPKQIQSVSALPPTERYGYFVRKVADFEELWGLHDEGWALMSDDVGNEVFPLWPERECAECLATGSWASCGAKAIALGPFLTDWLTGMADEGVRTAVFPTSSGKGVVVDPARSAEDLRDELQQYE